MIQHFIDQFMAAESQLKAELAAQPPDDYLALVTRVAEVLALKPRNDDYKDRPDPSRLTTIDYGSYQGTRLYVLGAQGYAASVFWTILVDYGSCSGCDAFEDIRDMGYRASTRHETDKQIDGYWTLMLHMVQNMKRIAWDAEDDAV